MPEYRSPPKLNKAARSNLSGDGGCQATTVPRTTESGSYRLLPSVCDCIET